MAIVLASESPEDISIQVFIHKCIYVYIYICIYSNIYIYIYAYI